MQDEAVAGEAVSRWGWEVIEPIACPLLESDEFRDALAHAGLTAQAVLERLRHEAADLAFLHEGILLSCGRARLALGEIRPRIRRYPYSALALIRSGGQRAGVGIVLSVITLGLVLPGRVVASGVAVVGLVLLLAAATRPGPPALDLNDQDKLRERVVIPYLRRLINDALDTPDREQSFRVAAAADLTDPSGGDKAGTSATREFWRLADTMDSGSIAVSGPRGMGKSALLQSLCGAEPAEAQDRAPGVGPGFMVSAPVGYEAHDFVQHLFKELCRRVLDYPVWRELSPPQGPRRGWGAAVVFGAAAFAIAQWGLPDPSEVTGSAAVWGALLCLLMSVLVFRVGNRPDDTDAAADVFREQDRVGEQMRELRYLQGEAMRHLRRMRYTSTYTTGYSGGLGLGSSLRLGRSRDHQLTENALALPELIEVYREFAAEVGRLRQSRLGQPGGGTLIIGIDEVDRIHDPEAAERFVNGVKAVFGSPYCLYVVAVPQPGPDGRGADLASAFDESMRMRRLTFADAHELLAARLTGISRPFSALCTVMSAGNPRDLLRYARLLIEEGRDGATTLEGLSARLVVREVAEVKEEARRVATAAPAIRLLLDENWPGTRPEEILAACRRLPGDDRDPLVRDRLLTPLYFLATVAAAFGPDRAATLADLRRGAADGPPPLALIVEAREHLDTHRALAHEMVSRFRAARGLGTVDLDGHDRPAGSGHEAEPNGRARTRSMRPNGRTERMGRR